MAAKTPPGSLSILQSFRALLDRNFYRDEGAKLGPIFKMAQYHKPAICLIDLALGHRLLREHADSLGAAIQPFTHDVSGGFLRYMDHATHKIYGPMFRRALSRPIVTQSIQCAHEVVRRRLQQVSPAVDLEQQLRIATREVFTRVLLGIEPNSPAYQRFQESFVDIAKRHVRQRLGPKAVAALQQLRGKFRTAPEQVCALSELAVLQGGEVDDIAIDNLLFILRNSANDMSGLLVWVVEFLGLHPEWLEKMRVGDVPDLPARIMKETVRLSRSEYLYRLVNTEFEFEGYVFPKGWLVRICVAEGHRDPRWFPDPDRFNPDRFLNYSPPENQYSPFGIREHACNGVDLSMMLGSVLIEELAAYEIVLSNVGKTKLRFRHWNHWMPKTKVMLRKRL